MLLKEYNNRLVNIIDVNNQVFFGISLYENKNVHDTEYYGLSIKTKKGWIEIFENEIKTIEILD